MKNKFLVLVLILSASAFTVMPEAFARAGGGRNGGAGGIAYIILMPFFLAYAWYVNKQINKKQQQTEVLLQQLAKKDPSWSETALEATARTLFMEIQKAWTEQDLPALKARIHPVLFPEWKAEIEMAQANGQRNIMENVTISGIRIVEAQKYKEVEKDSFSACIDAGAIDYTVDKTGTVVDSNVRSKGKKANLEKKYETFREFWTFMRQDGQWLLARVDQAGEWKKSVAAPLVDEE